MKIRHVWTAGLCLSCCATVAVAQQNQERKDRQERDQASQKQQDTKFSGELHSANEMLGMNIENMQGDEVGTVEDFVLDRDQNRVTYALVSYGGILGVGENRYPVPWKAFSHGDDHLLLDISEERVEQAPSFNRGHIPDDTDMAFHQQVHEFYGVKPYELEKRDQQKRQNLQADQKQQPGPQAQQPGPQAQQPGPQAQQPGTQAQQQAEQQAEQLRQQAQQQRQQADNQLEADPDRDAARDSADIDAARDFNWGGWADRDKDNWARKLTEIIGTSVENAEGDGIAEVEDVIIEANEGRIAYALVSYGETLGLFGDTAAVPWSALNLDWQDEVYSMNVQSENLDQYKVDEDAIERLKDEQFSRDMHQAYNVEPYWIAYGYITVTEPDRQPQGQQPQDKRQQGQQETITGVVASIGTYQEQPQGQQPQGEQPQDQQQLSDRQQQIADGIRIRIRTEDGQSRTVHLADRQELEQKNIRILPGDQVTIQGQEKQYRNHKVFQATKVEKDGETFELSSRMQQQPGQPQSSR